MCSLGQIEKLHRIGHEIGSHTYSHRRCKQISNSELLREHLSCERELKCFGGGRNFALPFGAYDNSTLNFLSGRYDTIRTIHRGINTGLTDLNLLKANAIYESSDLDQLKSLIDQTKKSGGWLIFYTHDVCAAPSEVGCTADRLQQIINWVKEAELPVNTVANTYRLLNNA